jgi:hypothetical protein
MDGLQVLGLISMCSLMALVLGVMIGGKVWED